jgi:hypothetical protein
MYLYKMVKHKADSLQKADVKSKEFFGNRSPAVTIHCAIEPRQ